jgi:hypothetical protein
MPLSEESLSEAANMVYGNGYSGDDLTDYQDGLDYKPLKQWEKYMIAGQSKDWIEQVINEKEGSIELLHEQFIDKYKDLKEQGLTIEANNLLIPVGKWALSNLEIDDKRNPWALLGSNCRYTKEIGLEIGSNTGYNSYVAV